MDTCLPLLFIPMTYSMWITRLCCVILYIVLFCCVCVTFTVKGAVVCEKVPAVLWLPFSVHHPGAHGERRRRSDWTTCEEKMKYSRTQRSAASPAQMKTNKWLNIRKLLYSRNETVMALSLNGEEGFLCGEAFCTKLILINFWFSGNS